jgi:hypothetical protein
MQRLLPQLLYMYACYVQSHCTVHIIFGMAHLLQRAPACLPSSHHHVPQTPLELSTFGPLQLLVSPPSICASFYAIYVA